MSQFKGDEFFIRKEKPKKTALVWMRFVFLMQATTPTVVPSMMNATTSTVATFVLGLDIFVITGQWKGRHQCPCS